VTTFDPETHTYEVDGVRWPSVTELIEYAGLKNNFGHTPFYAQRGKYVHRAIELDVKGTLDIATVDPEVRPGLEAWRDFRAASECEVAATERRVFNAELRYGGTMDLLLEMEGRFFVTDVKYGSPAPWHGLQAFMYRDALLSEGYSHYAEPAVLYLRKNGRYSWRLVEEDLTAQMRLICEKWWADHAEVKELWGG
jgi:hypothetical protein